MNIEYKNINNLKKVFLHKTLLLGFLSIFNTAYASGNADKNWNFKVTLDGDEIGFHNFSIMHKADHQEIYSNARFNVKFMFINVYSYKHDNVERWNGRCLDSINAITDDNGDLYNVSGKADNGAFLMNSSEHQKKYSSCIKTFAYWDPEFLEETILLNSQTGEMVEVNSEFIGKENLIHKGEEVTARHYRLNGENLKIDLWYSLDDEWLALESLTEGGRIVRYTMP